MNMGVIDADCDAPPLPPADLQRLLAESVDSVIDTDLFNIELDLERQDAGALETARRRVHRALADLQGG